METKTILLIILLSIGALQGIVYGGILWNTKTIHRNANRFLAAILFFFAYRLIAEILHFFGLGRYDTWYYILLELNWAFGALIYFFAVSYVTPNFKLKGRHWIHFLPVTIEVIWSFFIKSQNFYWDGTRESLSWLGYWGYVVWMHYPTMYVISGALIILYSYKAIRVLRNPPTTPGYQLIVKNTNWIKRVILVLRIFSMLFIAIVLIDFFFFDYAYNFFGDPIFVSMAVITYWLGLEGLSRRNTLAYKEVEILTEKDQRQLASIAQKMEVAMREKELFRKQELTLAAFSEAIDTKPYLVSKTLTTVLNKKFPDYVNELRFNALTNLLKDPKNSNFTLLSLAFDAGFNSKASFNRTVVRLTGKSPKHLKKGN